ncbi:MAG: ABC transporter permease [Chloroflexota bacterium]
MTAAPEALGGRPGPSAVVRRRVRRPADLGPVGVVISIIALLFLGLPVAALLGRAVLGGELLTQASERAVLDALALSLLTTLASLVLAVVFGTPLALLLTRREFRGKALAEAIIDLPIVLPPTVAGLALLLVLGRRGILGTPLDAVGISIPFTILAVVLAQTFVAAPLYIRSVRAGFASVDRTVEEAAEVDGAGRLALLARVTLPLAAPALGGGLALAWARALGEFGATIMFAGNIQGRTQTLPLVVYSEFQSSDLDSSVAAAAVLVVAAFGVLVAVRLTRWRRGLDWRGMI